MKTQPKQTICTMTPSHPQWDGFCRRLGGDEGCNFTQSDPNNAASVRWACNHTHAISRRLLAAYPEVDVEQTLAYFRDNGGYCDCEILFNVA